MPCGQQRALGEKNRGTFFLPQCRRASIKRAPIFHQQIPPIQQIESFHVFSASQVKACCKGEAGQNKNSLYADGQYDKRYALMIELALQGKHNVVVQKRRKHGLIREHELSAEEHALGKPFGNGGRKFQYFIGYIKAGCIKPLGIKTIALHVHHIFFNILMRFFFKALNVFNPLEITGINNADLDKNEIFKIIFKFEVL